MDVNATRMFVGVVQAGSLSAGATRLGIPLPLRVFGRLPGAGAGGCTEAGVRKASREETAGKFAPAVVSDYGDLAAAFAVIFRF
jgi:hypothetical protein